jgi:hypothetical protein
LAAQGAVQCLAKMVSLTCLFVLLEWIEWMNEWMNEWMSIHITHK